MLRPAADPFSADGGLKLLRGNLGRAVIKVSAVAAQHRIVEAPARVFDDQDAVSAASSRRARSRRGRGRALPGTARQRHAGTARADAAAGGRCRSAAHRVALVTDGRMSGASGSVPAAIHVCRRNACRAARWREVRDGDIIRLDSVEGTLEARVPQDSWSRRTIAAADLTANAFGMGRELFRVFRASAAPAEEGGGIC